MEAYRRIGVGRVALSLLNSETIPSMTHARMTYSELVRQLDEKLGPPQEPVTKPFSGTGYRLDVPIMQRFHRYSCEAWANLQATQSAGKSGDSADQGTSSLPVLTPQEMHLQALVKIWKPTVRPVARKGISGLIL